MRQPLRPRTTRPARGGVSFGDYPLAQVPLQEIVEKVESGRLAAKPAKVFSFEEIVAAHRLVDAGEAGGKLVVSLRLV